MEVSPFNEKENRVVNLLLCILYIYIYIYIIQYHSTVLLAKIYVGRNHKQAGQIIISPQK